MADILFTLANPPAPHKKTNKLAQSLLDDFSHQWLAEVKDKKARSHILSQLPSATNLLKSVFATSPFLTRLIRTRADFLPHLFSLPPHKLIAFTRKHFVQDMAKLEMLLQGAPHSLQAVPSSALHSTDLPMSDKALFSQAQRILRLARQEIALTTALCDVGGVSTLEEITKILSDFADDVVKSALSLLFWRAKQKNIFHNSARLDESGLIVIAMGKYGAQELNYSSDIDLVVFYEPNIAPINEGLDEQKVFVELVQDFVALLQEHTKDGFVFRVDLRLRPDPGTTKIAVSLPAAELYYESLGQNWERACFIKARFVAGDKSIAKKFFQTMRPFVWRRHLDFAMIEDIHSIKRQIHAVIGQSQMGLLGHNVKLGHGGIREIEFFVQTQQLIAGGRDEDLRGRSTCKMLDMLAKKDWIKAEIADDMKRAYRFLRTVEHRLQMRQDEQTHTLPSTQEDLEVFSCFMGFEDALDFTEHLYKHLEKVQTYYQHLFAGDDALAGRQGNLVFTGTDNDPETLLTLEAMGFKSPAQIANMIRVWHHGRYPTTKDPKSRAILTRLIPQLLQAFARTYSPDETFRNFDMFLERLPAGVQIFSLLQSAPKWLDLLANIMGAAPRFAKQISANPQMLDVLLDQRFSDNLGGLEELEADLSAYIRRGLELHHMKGDADKLKIVLDHIRLWSKEIYFRIGAQSLTRQLDVTSMGLLLSAHAEATIHILEPFLWEDFYKANGKIDDKLAGFAIVAMGKFGSKDMGTLSDLDLIFISDAKASNIKSKGKHIPLDVYHNRFARKIITALSTPTEQGALFEVDMRLRPFGASGALVTKLSSFESYEKKDAWVWEHMALTRARIISAPPHLERRLKMLFMDIICQKRDKGKLFYEVLSMRERIAREKGDGFFWSMKYAKGGLIDIEFIAQALQLLYGHTHPSIVSYDTMRVLQQATHYGLLTKTHYAILSDAFCLQSTLMQLIHLCLGQQSLGQQSLGQQSLGQQIQPTNSANKLASSTSAPTTFPNKPDFSANKPDFSTNKPATSADKLATSANKPNLSANKSGDFSDKPIASAKTIIFPKAFQDILCYMTNNPSLDVLVADLTDKREKVRAVFNEILQ